MSDIYNDLGVKKIINAAGTYTVLGGSRMSEKTLEDIRAAAGSFVRIRDLQAKINAEIARMTRNEAAYVTNGAAAGLYLATCAAVQRHYGKRHFYVTKPELRACNALVFKAHRNPYDYTIGQAGVQYKEIGYPNFILPVTAEDFEAAFDDNTCMVYYVWAVWTPDGASAIGLEDVIRIAHEHGVPVVVDAAAQLPPLENLWKFTAEMGADAALFSGGKDIRGPQSSGLMVGSRDFIADAASIGFPVYGAGRMQKVGREEQVGLYSALKQYIEMDHDARAEWCEGEVRKVIDAFAASPVFRAERSFPNEAGQPIARAWVHIVKEGVDVEAVKTALLDGDPAVFVMDDGHNNFFINPMEMYEGETETVIAQLKKLDNNL